MIWGVVHPPSVVRVAIISESIERISFKFQLLLAPSQTFFNFWKTRVFQFLYRFLYLSSFSLSCMRPHESKKSKLYSFLKSLLSFSNFSWIFSGPLKSTALDFWNFDFTIFICFRFRYNYGTLWEQKFQNDTPPSNGLDSSLKWLLNFIKLHLNFLLSGHHKMTVLDFRWFTIFIFHEYFVEILPPSLGHIGKPKTAS